MAPPKRKRKAPAVYRYPVRFTQSQLALATNLLASTGIAKISTLVHFAFAQLAKTAVGLPLGAAQAPTEPRASGSDPELENNF